MGNYEKALNLLQYFDPEAEKANLKASNPAEGKVKFPSHKNLTESYIGRDMVVRGDIISEDSVYVNGNVNGEINSTADVAVAGMVNGNVTSRNLMVSGLGVKGNINVQRSVKVEKDVVIVGDINAQELVADGKIKGQVSINGATVLKGNALVAGSVITGSLSVDDGARVNADIKIRDVQTQTACYNEQEFDI